MKLKKLNYLLSIIIIIFLLFLLKCKIGTGKGNILLTQNKNTIFQLCEARKNNINESTDGETVVKYYKSGVKLAEGKMKNGKMVGRWITYWPDGSKSHEEYYDEEGQRHGKQIFFDEKGNPIKEIYWEHGKMIKSKNLITGEEKYFK